MYRFTKDTSSRRLFVQGTTSDSVSPSPEPVDLKAIHTKKRLSTEVLGSSLESVKTSKSGDDGRRRITTKILRKVTTLTRGEEQSRDEELVRHANLRSIESGKEVVECSNKKVKVRMIVHLRSWRKLLLTETSFLPEMGF
nr:unnamed protein product [Callosobruchus chinensis]